MKKRKVIDNIVKLSLINKPDFSNIENKIDYNKDIYITKEENSKIKRKSLLKFSLITVSSIILLLIITFSTVSLTIDAAEYHVAKTFLEQNNLEIEGLSRKEIKNIYKDITTNSFTYTKTGEVLNTTLLQNVGGFEIKSDNYTPVDLKSLWEYWIDLRNNASTSGIKYQYESKGGYYQDNVKIPLEKRIVKYIDNVKIWEYDVTKINIMNVKVFDDIVIGYSDFINQNESMFDYNSTIGNIIILNATDGSLLYENSYTNNPTLYERVNTIIDNKDNTFTLISNIDQKWLCLMTINNQAKITKTIKKDYTMCSIRSVATFEDGYLILFNEFYNSGIYDKQKVMKVDKEGNFLSEFSYTSDDVTYVINDMKEYNNKIYLSCYEFPKQENYYDREIMSIIKYISEKGDKNVSIREVTNLIKAHYKATLLVCDFDNGIPEVFYSVEESIGASLDINSDGLLVWDVESISIVKYSPYTNSFTFGGICKLYEYTFNEKNLLISKHNTKEMTEFRR